MPSGLSSLTPSSNSPAGLSGHGSQRSRYSASEIPQIGAALDSEPRARPDPQRARLAAVLPGPPRAGLAAHPLHRRRQIRIDSFEVMRIAAALDKGPHRAGGF